MRLTEPERRNAIFLAVLAGIVATILLHADHLGEQIRGLWPMPQALVLLAFELFTTAFSTLVAYLIIRAYQRERRK